MQYFILILTYATLNIIYKEILSRGYPDITWKQYYLMATKSTKCFSFQLLSIAFAVLYAIN